MTCFIKCIASISQRQISSVRNLVFVTVTQTRANVSFSVLRSGSKAWEASGSGLEADPAVARLRAKVTVDQRPGAHGRLPPSAAVTPALCRIYRVAAIHRVYTEFPQSAAAATQPQRSVKTKDQDFKDLQDCSSQQHEITV